MKKPMSEKSPEIRDFIEHVFPGTVAAIDANTCPLCKRAIEIKDFPTPLYVKEYQISGLCFMCQDSIFKSD